MSSHQLGRHEALPQQTVRNTATGACLDDAVDGGEVAWGLGVLGDVVGGVVEAHDPDIDVAVCPPAFREVPQPLGVLLRVRNVAGKAPHARKDLGDRARPPAEGEAPV